MAEPISDALKETVLQDKAVQDAIGGLRKLIPEETATEYRRESIPIYDNKNGFDLVKKSSIQFLHAQLKIMDAAAAVLKKNGVADAPTSDEILMAAPVGLERIPNQQALQFEMLLIKAAKSGEPLGPVTEAVQPTAPSGGLPVGKSQEKQR